MTEDSCSFAAPRSSASGSHEQRNKESVEGKNKWTACGMPVKGHLGLCGSAKCLYSPLSKVTSRVDELEQAGHTCQEELESLQSLNSDRHVALLEAIRFQQERIEKLKEELKILKRETKDEGVVPPLPEKQLDHENVQSVSPTNSAAPTSSTPKSLAERKPACSRSWWRQQPFLAAYPSYAPNNGAYVHGDHSSSRKELISGFITVKSRRNELRQRIAPASSQHTHTFHRKRARSLPLWKEQNELCASFSISLALFKKQPLKMSSIIERKKEWMPPDATLYQHVCGEPKQWSFFFNKQLEQVVLASDFWPDLI